MLKAENRLLHKITIRLELNYKGFLSPPTQFERGKSILRRHKFTYQMILCYLFFNSWSDSFKVILWPIETIFSDRDNKTYQICVHIY